MQTSTIAVMFLIFITSFRVRQMVAAGYLIRGAHFQYADFAMMVFAGVSWVETELINVAIHLIIGGMMVKVFTMCLAMKSLEELQEWGLFQLKYFPELHRFISQQNVVMLEITLDVALFIMLIKCLEIVEAEILGLEEGDEEEEEEVQ